MCVCVCVHGLGSVFGADLTFACRMCGQWPGPNHSFIDRFHSECVSHAPPLCIINNKQLGKSILVSIMQTGTDSSVLEK